MVTHASGTSTVVAALGQAFFSLSLGGTFIWRLILIDHSRAFRATRSYTRDLLYVDEGDGPLLIDQLPARFLEAIESLDLPSLHEALAPYLTPKEIRGIVARQRLLLSTLAKGRDRRVDATAGPPAP